MQFVSQIVDALNREMNKGQLCDRMDDYNKFTKNWSEMMSTKPVTSLEGRHGLCR
jgi:hypothetical protein